MAICLQKPGGKGMFKDAADAANSPALDAWMTRNGRLGQVLRIHPNIMPSAMVVKEAT